MGQRQTWHLECVAQAPAFSSFSSNYEIQCTQLELFIKVWQDLWIYVMGAITRQLMIIVIANAFLLISVWDRGLTTVIPHQLFTPSIFWYGHLWAEDDSLLSRGVLLWEPSLASQLTTEPPSWIQQPHWSRGSLCSASSPCSSSSFHCSSSSTAPALPLP